MRIRLLGALLPFAMLALAGCGGDEENELPQILPALNPVAFGNLAPTVPADCPGPECEDNCSGDRPCVYDLQLVNGGNQPLEISGIEVQGDVNCAIRETPEFESGGQTATVAGHGSVFLHFEYMPGGATPSPIGTDQINLVISSNASDYAELEISICGCVVDGDPQEAEFCACDLNQVPASSCQS